MFALNGVYLLWVFLFIYSNWIPGPLAGLRLIVMSLC